MPSPRAMTPRTSRGAAVVVVACLFPALLQLPVTSTAATVQYAAPAAVVLSEASCENDWVEVANTDTSRSARIAGWFISDAMPAAVRTSYRFGKTAVLKPGARMVVKASALPFKIGCGSDNVYLARTTTSVVDRVSVPNLNPGFTWGRVNGSWTAATPTAGRANQAVPAGAEYDRAAWLFDPLTAHKVLITADPADLKRLVTTPKEYVPAKFRLQDAAGNLLPTAGPLDVGLRVKGSFGSLTDPYYGEGGLNIVDDKVSLKIKFNFSVKGQEFLGLKKLTLNSMVQDRTMVHETLAYRLMREQGIIAPRTGFANVYINDSLRGLFLNLEGYDEVSLAWHLPTMQHLYEGEAVKVHPDLTPKASAAFTVDEGDEKDTGDLTALVAAVTAGPGLGGGIPQRLDVQQLGTFLALEKVTNHWDGYSGSVSWAPNNVFLVSDAKGRFQFLPWGTDTTLRYLGLDDLDAKGGEKFDYAVGIMFKRCLADDPCAAAYRRTLAEAAARLAGYQAYADLVRKTHEASRLADTVRFSNEKDHAWAWSELVTFIKQRPLDVAAYLTTVVTGEVRWQPSAMKLAKGSALTAAHLNAYSDVPGSFSYSKPIGTRLPAGRTTVTVTFTPTDPARQPQVVNREFTVG